MGLNKKLRLARARKRLKRFLRKCERAYYSRIKRRDVHNQNRRLKLKAFKEGWIYIPRKYKHWRKNIRRTNLKSIRPPLPPLLNFFSKTKNVFSKTHFFNYSNGNLRVPRIFSLMENYEESFSFLKRLLFVLLKAKCRDLKIDFTDCQRIDVDASICMDLILEEGINHVKDCRNKRVDIFPQTITAENCIRKDVNKILYSIGAHRNLRGVSIHFDDVIALPVLINDKNSPSLWSRSELDQTKIVEYIKSIILATGRDLPHTSETELYKVIGEVMNNAEEHGTMPKRFAIGYFKVDESKQYGIFNFSIFNFGDTIYQTFKSANCKNRDVIAQMTRLSEAYTKKGFIFPSKFEEETLWTLYALQEGVTSLEKKRGNGSIQYIENFFKLKGNKEKDNISQLLVVSGNTRIVFDGTYEIFEKETSNGKSKFKMMTFNTEQDINVPPDKKFVTFASNFFPGTLISARILLKFEEKQQQQPKK
jgi:hypothetical protein